MFLKQLRYVYYCPHSEGMGKVPYYFTGVCLSTTGESTPSPSHNTSIHWSHVLSSSRLFDMFSSRVGVPQCLFPCSRSRLTWGGTPIQSLIGVSGQVRMWDVSNRASTFYAPGGMPLAFTQEDFLVLNLSCFVRDLVVIHAWNCSG